MSITNEETKVLEAHLSTGKTIPLRRTKAKAGHDYFGTLFQKNNGEQVFLRLGVSVPVSVTGHPDKIDSIRVDGVGDVKVKHDVTEPYYDTKKRKVTSPGGKPRATAEQEVTVGNGEKWVFTFRATLINEDAVNVVSCLRPKTEKQANGPRKLRLQSTL